MCADGSTPPPALQPTVTSCDLLKAAKKDYQNERLAHWPQWQLKAPVDRTVKDITKVAATELSDREREIVHHDATSLAEAIRARRYTSVEVLEAFCHAAVVAHQLTNCITEIFIEEGLARAAELDKHLEKTGEVVGPLHGVPVSIKDHINVRGQDTSSGYVSWAFRSYAKKDAMAVDILRKAGATLYVKTANPEMLMSLETNNDVFGRTLNPFNRTLTPGGSSGGESALISSRGSALGVGTDIGGSIRAPAAHTGLYGLKCSVSRLPHAGLKGSYDGLDAIIGALGPLATSARDLSLFCQVMLECEPWFVEPQILPMPWKQDVVEDVKNSQKLCFAIIWDDGVAAPHPPILDALRRTKAALLAAGHEVISWDPCEHEEAWDLITKLYMLDGGEEYRQIIHEAGNPAQKSQQTRWFLSQAHNDDKPYSIPQIFDLTVARDEFRMTLAELWNKSVSESGRCVDVILSPCAPTLAPPHDTTCWWGYTSYWNLADYPAVSFPVGQHNAAHYSPSRETLEDLLVPRTPRNDIEKFIQSQWDPEIYDGAPVSLQLIGRRLLEEKLLGALAVVENALGARDIR